MIRSLMKLANVVKELEVVRDRLALQKSMYILEETGIDLAYVYRWYILGPYSSRLATDMFKSLRKGLLDADRGGYCDFRLGRNYTKWASSFEVF